MEAAPLTLAHTHARNAVFETRKSNPVAASEEHDLAAGEFSTAAQKCSDQEARRTLLLLETHHKKLAEILRFQHEHPEASNANSSPNPGQAAADATNTRVSAASQETHGQPPRLPGHPRLPSRESSSIANNLATARGIPAQPRRGSPVSPTLSAQQAGSRMSENKAKTGESRLREAARGDRSSRAPQSRQSWIPPSGPSDVTSKQGASSETARNARRPAADEQFQGWYTNVFEGLVSKITAPLAFAGLPLGLEDPAKAGSASNKSAAEAKVDRNHATSDRSIAEPDVNKLFSKAALRSLRDSQIQSNPADSFCIVPITGGTKSYAEILTRAEREARRNSLEDDDDFVDARETPFQSPELRQSASNIRARMGRRSTGDKQLNLRLEELETENQILKQASDTLSKRLHMWEMNAQTSSMALHQSLRGALNTSPVATMTATPRAPSIDPRIKELEDQLRRNKEDLERTGAENEKLKSSLGRYRQKWDQLKEGAKNRRAETRANEAQSNASTPLVSSKTPDAPMSPQPDTDSSDNPAGRGAAKPRV